MLQLITYDDEGKIIPKRLSSLYPVELNTPLT